MTREITEAEYRETIEIMGMRFRSFMHNIDLADDYPDKNSKIYDYYSREANYDYNKYLGMEELASELFGKTRNEIFMDVSNWLAEIEKKARKASDF